VQSECSFSGKLLLSRLYRFVGAGRCTGSNRDEVWLRGCCRRLCGWLGQSHPNLGRHSRTLASRARCQSHRHVLDCQMLPAGDARATPRSHRDDGIQRRSLAIASIRGLRRGQGRNHDVHPPHRKRVGRSRSAGQLHCSRCGPDRAHGSRNDRRATSATGGEAIRVRISRPCRAPFAVQGWVRDVLSPCRRLAGRALVAAHGRPSSRIDFEGLALDGLHRADVGNRAVADASDAETRQALV
jgi:hypothetical protein